MSVCLPLMSQVASVNVYHVALSHCGSVSREICSRSADLLQCTYRGRIKPRTTMSRGPRGIDALPHGAEQFITALPSGPG